MLLLSALKPIPGLLSSNYEREVKHLNRPYIAITEKQYNELLDRGHDFYLYNGRVVTFGTADGGYALMPYVKERLTQ